MKLLYVQLQHRLPGLTPRSEGLCSTYIPSIYREVF